MLSNYPPNVTGNEGIFGDKIRTISYTITFRYTTDLDNDEDICHAVTSYTGVSDITFHDDTHIINADGSHSIDISYSDDIELDPRGMDAYDIEYEIIKHTNNIIRDANIDPRDDVDIDYDIHQ